MYFPFKYFTSSLNVGNPNNNGLSQSPHVDIMNIINLLQLQLYNCFNCLLSTKTYTRFTRFRALTLVSLKTPVGGISWWFARSILRRGVARNVRSRAQSTVGFPIGGHVNVLSDYTETVHEKQKVYAITAVMSLI